MTSKHFRLIADALRAERPSKSEDSISEAIATRTWWRICEQMARSLATTNPRFNRERFLTWCAE